MDKKSQQILLIDTNAIIHRAYHAYPPNLKNKKGQLTNAVYGLTTMLLDLLLKFKPEYILCAMDIGKSKTRLEIYKDYKANRTEMDPELREQFPLVVKLLEAMNIPVLTAEGYEADDVIGTMAKNILPADLRKTIVTGDQDILQLIDDDKNIEVFLAGTSFSKSKLYNNAEFEKKYGFLPSQLIDYKAIRGDSSDNIPGVKGVGDKGAKDLLSEFPGITEIYSSIEKEDQKWEEKPFSRMLKKLSAQRDQAEMSYKLATIITDMKKFDEFKLADAQLREFDYNNLLNLFKDYEFKSIIPKLDRLAKSINVKVDSVEISEQDSLVSIENRLPDENVEILIEVAQAKTFLNNIIDGNYELISFDTETNSLDSLKAGILGLGIAYNEDSAKYLPVRLLENKVILDLLQKIFDLGTSKNSKLTIAAHNLKFDLQILLNIGLKVASSATFFDTMIAAFILNKGERKKVGLKHLADEQLQLSLSAFETVETENEQKLGVYCGQDAIATYRLAEKYRKELAEDPKLLSLFSEIEMPLVRVLMDMENNGIVLSRKPLEDLDIQITKMIKDIQSEIYEMSDSEFNLNSPKQVSEVLFEKLKIQNDSQIRPKKLKSGHFSTNERALRDFATDHPIAEKILEYRELAKLKSTYIDSLLKEIPNDKESEIIHTNYQQTVTTTGRLSSNSPNLQNIPISSDLGKKIRAGFSAGKNRKLLAFDYAQQELRLLAAFSKEANLQKAFRDGQDIHSLTASKILDLPIEEVTKQERRVGKTVNFGVVYGISGFGLADRLKISRKEADIFIEKFFNSYPKIADYFEKLKLTAKEKGKIYSIGGRIKLGDNLNSSNYQIRAATERELINFPLQASAADITKIAMINLYKELQIDNLFSDLKLHLQVHDEIITSVPSEMPKERLDQVISKITKIMENVVELEVPLLVDYEIGDDWYSLTSE